MCTEKIIKKLNDLISEEFQYFNRTLDLIELGFGELTERTDRHGAKYKLAHFVYHIQCPFRVIRDDSIVLSTEDLFLPFPSEQPEEADLNKRNSTLFDSKAKYLTTIMKGEKIIDIKLNSQNDLTIRTETTTIDLFVCNVDSESWRFFDTIEDSPHIVVDERGISED